MFVMRREAIWFVYERTIYPASTVLSGRGQAFSLARVLHGFHEPEAENLGHRLQDGLCGLWQ